MSGFKKWCRHTGARLELNLWWNHIRVDKDQASTRESDTPSCPLPLPLHRKTFTKIQEARKNTLHLEARAAGESKVTRSNSHSCVFRAYLSVHSSQNGQTSVTAQG